MWKLGTVLLCVLIAGAAADEFADLDGVIEHESDWTFQEELELEEVAHELNGIESESEEAEETFDSESVDQEDSMDTMDSIALADDDDDDVESNEDESEVQDSNAERRSGRRRSRRPGQLGVNENRGREWSARRRSKDKRRWKTTADPALAVSTTATALEQDDANPAIATEDNEESGSDRGRGRRGRGGRRPRHHGRPRPRPRHPRPCRGRHCEPPRFSSRRPWSERSTMTHRPRRSTWGMASNMVSTSVDANGEANPSWWSWWSN